MSQTLHPIGTITRGQTGVRDGALHGKPRGQPIGFPDMIRAA